MIARFSNGASYPVERAFLDQDTAPGRACFEPVALHLHQMGKTRATADELEPVLAPALQALVDRLRLGLQGGPGRQVVAGLVIEEPRIARLFLCT